LVEANLSSRGTTRTPGMETSSNTHKSHMHPGEQIKLKATY
jgi:hypothetical protein